MRVSRRSEGNSNVRELRRPFGHQRWPRDPSRVVDAHVELVCLDDSTPFQHAMTLLTVRSFLHGVMTESDERMRLNPKEKFPETNAVKMPDWRCHQTVYDNTRRLSERLHHGFEAGFHRVMIRIFEPKISR